MQALMGQAAPTQQAQRPRLNIGLDKLKQAAQLAQAVKNPDKGIQQLVSQNPLVQQANQIAAQYGGDYDKAFLGVCQENGINPNELLAEIKLFM